MDIACAGGGGGEWSPSHVFVRGICGSGDCVAPKHLLLWGQTPPPRVAFWVPVAPVQLARGRLAGGGTPAQNARPPPHMQNFLQSVCVCPPPRPLAGRSQSQFCTGLQVCLRCKLSPGKSNAGAQLTGHRSIFQQQLRLEMGLQPSCLNGGRTKVESAVETSKVEAMRFSPLLKADKAGGLAGWLGE